MVCEGDALSKKQEWTVEREVSSVDRTEENHTGPIVDSSIKGGLSVIAITTTSDTALVSRMIRNEP